MQPGEVIGPGGQPPQEPEKPAEVAKKATETASVEQISPEQPVEEPASKWQFRDEASDGNVPQSSARHENVEWTASEYIAHEKSPGWYLMLALAVAGFAAAVHLITDELISSVVIVVMGIAFGAFAARQPQELHYAINNTTLNIGNKSYSYGQFKSFTIVDEGPIHSIMLMPLQRFMPPLSVYFAPEDEDKIATALSSYLPYEDRKQDVVDRLMRKVRF
jgi:hypothetical protein